MAKTGRWKDTSSDPSQWTNSKLMRAMRNAAGEGDMQTFDTYYALIEKRFIRNPNSRQIIDYKRKDR